MREYSSALMALQLQALHEAAQCIRSGEQDCDCDHKVCKVRRQTIGDEQSGSGGVPGKAQALHEDTKWPRSGHRFYHRDYVAVSFDAHFAPIAPATHEH